MRIRKGPPIRRQELVVIRLGRCMRVNLVAAHHQQLAARQVLAIEYERFPRQQATHRIGCIEAIAEVGARSSRAAVLYGPHDEGWQSYLVRCKTGGWPASDHGWPKEGRRKLLDQDHGLSAIPDRDRRTSPRCFDRRGRSCALICYNARGGNDRFHSDGIKSEVRGPVRASVRVREGHERDRIYFPGHKAVHRWRAGS